MNVPLDNAKETARISLKKIRTDMAGKTTGSK
jgi:hypothetical protein